MSLLAILVTEPVTGGTKSFDSLVFVATGSTRRPAKRSAGGHQRHASCGKRMVSIEVSTKVVHSRLKGRQCFDFVSERETDGEAVDIGYYLNLTNQEVVRIGPFAESFGQRRLFVEGNGYRLVIVFHIGDLGTVTHVLHDVFGTVLVSGCPVRHQFALSWFSPSLAGSTVVDIPAVSTVLLISSSPPIREAYKYLKVPEMYVLSVQVVV